jgi:hypothetical protein
VKVLAGHAGFGPLLAPDAGNCENVLAKFIKAGIGADGLAAALRNEAARSFVESWNDLIAAIASKSATLNEPALKAGGSLARASE